MIYDDRVSPCGAEPSMAPRRTKRTRPFRARLAPPRSDEFAVSLKNELEKVQAVVVKEERTEQKGLGHRAAINRRLLQDLWEVDNQFETISVHLTLEPAATLFATIVEYPNQWTLRDSIDFGTLSTIELADRAAGWVGYGLRFWYYRDAEGRPRFRGIYEWTEGESYHRYSGWMRTMSQAVLVDAAESEVDLKVLQTTLRDVAVKWYAAHLNRSAESLTQYLKEKYPPGASYTKESYR